MKKSFTPRQKVLLYNSRLHLYPGKLKSRWIKPFLVKEVFPHGAVKIENSSNGAVFKINSQRLKSFLELTKESIDEAIILYEPTYLS